VSTLQTLQKVGKGTAEKTSRQTNVRKLAGTMLRWRVVVVHSRHEQ